MKKAVKVFCGAPCDNLSFLNQSPYVVTEILPADVVFKLVEAGHGDERTHTAAKRVEDLCGRVTPHL